MSFSLSSWMIYYWCKRHIIGCHQIRMHPNKAPATTHRKQILQNDARRRWYTPHHLVWVRRRLQCYGDRITWTIAWRSIQFLFSTVHAKNRSTASRSNDIPHRFHTFAWFHSSRHQAGQFPHGAGQKGQLSVYDWFWSSQKIPWLANTAAHTVPRE